MSDEIIESRMRLEAGASALPGGEFEILAITAGEGNGWTFPADVLRRSLTLWEGAECFVDHGGLMESNRSVRDLGGLLYGVTFDEEQAGIRARLRCAGPSGPLVAELGREMLDPLTGGNPLTEGNPMTAGTEGEHRPRVGFSADIGFTARGRQVVEILKVFSVDLVFNPARGGAFVRALNAVKEADMGQAMEDMGRRMEEPNASSRTLVHEGTIAGLREDASATGGGERGLLRLQCQATLGAVLDASDLPAVYREIVRGKFEGRVFSASELETEIAGLIKIRAAEEEQHTVRGAGAPANAGKLAHGGKPVVTAMWSDMDRLRLATERLLFPQELLSDQHSSVERLRGIQELYLLLSGDREFCGQFVPERVQFANANTGTMAALVANAYNKIIPLQWTKLGRAGYDWYEKAFLLDDVDNLHDLRWISVGGFGDLPTVAEGGAYTELTWDDKTETAAFVKKGGYIGLTLEMLDKDETAKVRAIPLALATAGIRTLSAACAALFSQNSAAGPNLADGGAWFQSNAVTRDGDGSTAGSGNLGTTALSAAEWLVACQMIYKKTELNSGKRLGLKPGIRLVPIELETTSRIIDETPRAVGSANNDINPSYGQVRTVVVPDWTDENDWCALTDPAVYPNCGLAFRYGRMPEVFVAGQELVGSMFTNDEMRIKTRFFFALGVCDWRGVRMYHVA